MKNLYFIEDDAHTNAFIKKIEANKNENNVIISLSPYVGLELDKRKISYNILEDYYSIDEFNNLALKNYIQLDNFCNFLNNYIISNSLTFRSLDLKPAFFHYFFLKILFDSVTMKLFGLQKAISKEKPHKLYFIFCKKNNEFQRSLFFEEESIYSQLLPLLAENNNIACEHISTEFRFLNYNTRLNKFLLNRLLAYPEKLKKGYSTMSRFLKTLSKDKKAYSISKNIKSDLKSLFYSKDFKDKKTILILEKTHDVKFVISEIKEKRLYKLLKYDFSKISDPKQIFPPSLKKTSFDVNKELINRIKLENESLWRKISNDKNFRSYFILNYIDYFSIVESRLKFFFTVGLKEIFVTHLKANQFLKYFNPFIILTSTTNLGYIGQTVMNAARKIGIPVVMYQEGAGFGIPYSPIYDHTDYYGCDYFLSYGNGTISHCKKNGINTKKIITIGSVALDSLVKEKEGITKYINKKVVMYVPTNIMGNIEHHPYNGGEGNYYFNIQKELVDIFKDYTDINFVIKLPVGIKNKPIHEYIKRENINNCNIVDDIQLSSLLHLSDAFIIDFPSTTLLQCAMTKKKIFVYLDKFITKVSDEALSLLKKRAVVSEDFAEFESLLRDSLSNKKFEEIVSGDEFLKAYCTHLNDGKSMERALNFLKNLSNTHPKTRFH